MRHWLRKRLGICPKLRLEYECASKRRLGSPYGGWWVCAQYLSSTSIVYSAGIGTDISFDLEMIREFGLTIHAFDPTPKSVAWVQAQRSPPQFVMNEVGIADYDGTAEFFAPRNRSHVSHSLVHQRNVGEESIRVRVARLATLMRERGHTELDVLKMDIEGAEYAVIESILQEKIPIRQLLVEFHHRFLPDGKARTEKAVHALRGAGYCLFAVADSTEECAFLRVD